MLEYKGFDIPETLEEFTMNMDISASDTYSPAIIARHKENGIILTIDLTIEEIMKDSNDIEKFVNVCKYCIDEFTKKMEDVNAN